jgi:hypothetical protein
MLPGLDKSGGESFIEVPPDDYRSIRRSILDISEFDVEQFKRRIATYTKTGGRLNISSLVKVLFSHEGSD